MRAQGVNLLLYYGVTARRVCGASLLGEADGHVRFPFPPPQCVTEIESLCGAGDGQSLRDTMSPESSRGEPPALMASRLSAAWRQLRASTPSRPASPSIVDRTRGRHKASAEPVDRPYRTRVVNGRATPARAVSLQSSTSPTPLATTSTRAT